MLDPKAHFSLPLPSQVDSIFLHFQSMNLFTYSIECCGILSRLWSTFGPSEGRGGEQQRSTPKFDMELNCRRMWSVMREWNTFIIKTFGLYGRPQPLVVRNSSKSHQINTTWRCFFCLSLVGSEHQPTHIHTHFSTSTSTSISLNF